MSFIELQDAAKFEVPPSSSPLPDPNRTGQEKGATVAFATFCWPRYAHRIPQS